MGALRKFGRRGFLIGSGAVAGGFAFGVYKLMQPAENPLELAGSLNAFVVINQDGITLVAPKAEMGQGVHTSWAALIAEELDVELSQLNVIHGPPAKAYYNSALFGLSLPFLDFTVGSSKAAIRQFMGNGAKLIGLQLTGGSTSMRDGFVRMRQAGASAREMLKKAAADEWNMPSSKLRTEAGFVIGPDGEKLAYQDLAAKAAGYDAPSPILREKEEWRLIGKTQPRVDMHAKVTGEAVYGSDIKFDDMLYAAVLQSPKRNGYARFDASQAQAMKGVEDVLALEDMIVVLAHNTWTAWKAAETIEVEWQASRYPTTTEALFEEIAAGFDHEPNSTPRDDGNADKDFDGEWVEAEYRTPILAHTTMEPMSAAALYENGKLTVWCGNQAAISTQSACAKAAGIPDVDVELHTTFLGGGFGRRSETDYAKMAARIAKAVPGTPIQMLWRREDDVKCDIFRPATMARYRGVVKDGKALMIDGQVSGASIAQESRHRGSDGERSTMADREHVTGAFDQPYDFSNYRMRGYVVPTNLPIGYWRSVGNSYNTFYMESFVDEMAHAAGADPLAFRLDLVEPVHQPSAMVIKRAGEIAGWGEPKAAGRGRGIAFSYNFGTPVAQVVELAERDGLIAIERVVIVCDVGVAIDPGNIEAQMVGGCLYGLSAAVMEEITLKDGMSEQSNFYDYDALRMFNSPKFEVEILEDNAQIGGVGECGTSPAAPALANALFDLTGQRVRELPLNKVANFRI